MAFFPIPNDNNCSATTLTYLARSNIFSARIKDIWLAHRIFGSHTSTRTILKRLVLLPYWYDRIEILAYYCQHSESKSFVQVEKSSGYWAISILPIWILRYKYTFLYQNKKPKKSFVAYVTFKSKYGDMFQFFNFGIKFCVGHFYRINKIWIPSNFPIKPNQKSPFETETVDDKFNTIEFG